MFVDIENFKSPIAVENILVPYKKGRLSDDKKYRFPKEKITPEVCFNSLLPNKRHLKRLFSQYLIGGSNPTVLLKWAKILRG